MTYIPHRNTIRSNLRTIAYADKYPPNCNYAPTPLSSTLRSRPTVAKKKKKKNNQHKTYHEERIVQVSHCVRLYFAAATVPQAGQRRLSSLVIQCSMAGLSSVSRSVRWKDASRMTVGVSCPGARQYQRKRSFRHDTQVTQAIV